MMMNGAVVSHCYASGTKTYATDYSGGIVGRKGAGTAYVEYCYTTGTVNFNNSFDLRTRGAISADAGVAQYRNIYSNLTALGNNQGTGSKKIISTELDEYKTYLNEG